MSHRAPEEMQQRLLGLTNLLHVTRLVAAEIDPERVLETVAEAARVALDCDRASVFQYDPANEQLFTRVVTALEIAEIRTQVGRGITGHVAATRQLITVLEPQTDARWNSSIDRATGYHTRNLMAAPLVSPTDGSLLGVLELINKQTGDFSAFDEELVEAFSQHAAVALDRARLVEVLRKRNEVEAALTVARDIQRGFMPRRLPEVNGYELASWWFPNQAVGGDYCDVFPLCDGRWALVMADVSGHGLGPSLLMASVRAALRALAIEHSRPDTLLGLLARSLEHDLYDGRFITMIVAVLDTAAQNLAFANAGHGPALVYAAAADTFHTLRATGMPLGVLHDTEYPLGCERKLGPGDLVLLCTDGIIEALNEADEPFGQRRLERLVAQHATEPVAEIVASVAREVTAHYVGESPPDDLTILIARRNR